MKTEIENELIEVIKDNIVSFINSNGKEIRRDPKWDTPYYKWYFSTIYTRSNVDNFYNKWVNENKERVAGYKKKWDDANRERIKEIKREWNDKNKDKIKEYCKKYKEENIIKYKESKKKWNVKNTEYFRITTKKYYYENVEVCRKRADDYQDSIEDEFKLSTSMILRNGGVEFLREHPELVECLQLVKQIKNY